MNNRCMIPTFVVTRSDRQEQATQARREHSHNHGDCLRSTETERSQVGTLESRWAGPLGKPRGAQPDSRSREGRGSPSLSDLFFFPDRSELAAWRSIRKQSWAIPRGGNERDGGQTAPHPGTHARSVFFCSLFNSAIS
jgi:hypothetical protein